MSEPRTSSTGLVLGVVGVVGCLLLVALVVVLGVFTLAVGSDGDEDAPEPTRQVYDIEEVRGEGDRTGGMADGPDEP